METAKLKTYSTRALQKLAQAKTGEDLEQINAVLAERGALTPHPSPDGGLYNGTETPEFQKELMEDTETLKAKTPKRVKAPRLTDEEAQALYARARLNKGKHAFCRHKGEPVNGTIKTAALDRRKNSVQYFILLEDGRLIGKTVSDESLFIMNITGTENEKPCQG